MEEPGRLQSMGLLRVGHDWATSLSLFTFHFHALEKEMVTHSSVLAWRIPGTGEPDELPSTGSHRVGHDWSDLAAVSCLTCKGFLGLLGYSIVWFERWKTQSFNFLFWLYKVQISFIFNFFLLVIGLNITSDDDHLLRAPHVRESETASLTETNGRCYHACLTVRSYC